LEPPIITYSVIAIRGGDEVKPTPSPSMEGRAMRLARIFHITQLHGQGFRYLVAIIRW